MWSIFRKSFAKSLDVFGISDGETVMGEAKKKYREIVGMIPAFGKNDILLVNILSAATVAAVYLSLPERASVEQVQEYYRRAMNDNGVMELFLRNTKNFTLRYQNKLKRDAKKSQQAGNPYTWRYTYIPGETLDSFDAVFDKCGICALFERLGISEITPAMCAYDYEMAKHTGTVFTREYTLASGGPVCDCHYKRAKQS